MASLGTTLPDRLFRHLQRGGPAILVTYGADGWPNAVMTWAATRDPHVVRFGVDLGTSTLANIQREGKASLHVIGPGNIIFLIKGATRLVKERLETLPPPHLMGMMELAVHAVKDQSWVGVMVSPLSFQWTGPDADRMRQAEQEVLAELREWS